MASDGLHKKASSGVCRMCQRRRCTEKHVKAVGEVLHGFATGHIWECVDTNNCDENIALRLANSEFDYVKKEAIKQAVLRGRFTTWVTYT